MKTHIQQLEKVIEELKERQTNMHKAHVQLLHEVERLEDQARAVKNYRMQTVTIPIMAELIGIAWQEHPPEGNTRVIDMPEFESLARIACQAGNALLTEIDERWPST